MYGFYGFFGFYGFLGVLGDRRMWGLTGLMWLLYIYCCMVKTPLRQSVEQDFIILWPEEKLSNNVIGAPDRGLQINEHKSKSSKGDN